MENRRLKVLIAAYACNPYKGSEHGVGWGIVSSLAKYHDLWVIVEEEKCRVDIENYLSENPDFSQTVKFFYLKKQRNRLLRKIYPPSYYWYYHHWHRKALTLAQSLHQEMNFDLAHQLTMVGFREPGYLWKLGIPFVWGPVGGMGYFPWRFLTTEGLYGAIYYIGYNLFNAWQTYLPGRSKLAAKIAGKGFITATSDNQRIACSIWNCSSTVICEVGLPLTILKPKQVISRKKGDPIRLTWSGQHTHGKALSIALNALAKLPNNLNWELNILGQGSRTQTWKRTAQKLNIENTCKFHHWLPREKAMEIMSNSHIMLITSLRDLTSTVTIEALAFGLPIICLDHCGFSDAIDETCGIKIVVTNRYDVTKKLAEGIIKLAEDETLRLALANGALKRAELFSWDNKVKIINQIYQQKNLRKNRL